MPKMTNDQLSAMLANSEKNLEIANKNIESILDDSKRIRKEFAKSFGWMQQKQYHLDNEPKLPSWEEIFVEVGRLLVNKQRYEFGQDLVSLDHQVDFIKTILDENGIVKK